MRFSVHQLRKFCPAIPTEEKSLRDLFDDTGLEVKKFETTKEDFWVTLEILANRGDHYSYLGVAKEIAAKTKSQCLPGLNKTKKTFLPPPDLSGLHSAVKNSVHFSYPSFHSLSLLKDCAPSSKRLTSLNHLGFPLVKIESSLCLSYALLDLSLKSESTKKMKALNKDSQAVLKASGLLSGHSLIDISNLVNYELGQPLHFFDKKKVKGTVKVRESRKGEEAWLLFEEKKRKLPEGALLIADEEKVIAVAGVMGCEDSKVDESTQDILIESGTFDPVSVRKTANHLALQTDSSNRFQRGADSDLVLPAMDWVLNVLDEWDGIQNLNGCFYYKSSKIQEKSIQMNLEDAEDFFDEKISREEMMDILKSYDFFPLHDSKNKSHLNVIVPMSRFWDVKNEMDLYEEVARYKGYNSFSENLPEGSIGIEPSKKQRTLQWVNRFLVFSGFFEIFTNNFYGREILKKLKLSKEHPLFPHLETKNALDRSYSLLKNNCFAHAFEAIYQNTRFKNNHFKMFEWSKIYSLSSKSENGICEEKSLLWGSVSGLESPLAWDGLKRNMDFYWVKGFIEEMFFLLRLDLKFASSSDIEKKGFSVKEESPFFHPYKHFFLLSKGKKVGVFGELHPDFLENFSIKALKPCYFQIDKETLFQSCEEGEIQFPPKIPDIQRDFSLHIPKDFPLVSLHQFIKKISPPWLKSFRVKDKYIPKETKAFFVYTYELNLDGEKGRSLKEINGLLENIIHQIENQFGAQGVKLKQ